jgi:hypothetical protein
MFQDCCIRTSSSSLLEVSRFCFKIVASVRRRHRQKARSAPAEFPRACLLSHLSARYRTNNKEKAEKCIMQGGPEKGYPMRVVLTRAAPVVLNRAAP